MAEADAGARRLRGLAAQRPPPRRPACSPCSPIAPRPPQAQTDTGGLPPEWARALSAPFVLHPRYGTRCASVLLLGAAGELQLIEQRFDAAGQEAGRSEFTLGPGEWP